MQYLVSPTQAHLKSLVRVLRYLKDTIKLGIYYKRGDIKGFVPNEFADASLGRNLSTRRSMSGMIVILCGALVI